MISGVWLVRVEEAGVQVFLDTRGDDDRARQISCSWMKENLRLHLICQDTSLGEARRMVHRILAIRQMPDGYLVETGVIAEVLEWMTDTVNVLLEYAPGGMAARVPSTVCYKRVINTAHLTYK